MPNDFKYHIDHHGGLSPTPALTEARSAYARGELDASGLRAAEDAAITESLGWLRRVGVNAVGDGALRRSDPFGIVYAAVDGFAARPGSGGAAVAALLGAHAPESRPLVSAPVARSRLAAAESGYLRGITDHPLLITLPSPGWVAELTAPGAADAAGAALAVIVREEVAALAAEGVLYVLLQNPLYTHLLTARGAERAKELGIDPAAVLERMLAADAAVLDGLRTPEDFRIGLDLTTGGAADLSGGYDETLVASFLERQPYFKICVEYPAHAAHRFPLGLVRPGTVVSLGVVDVRTANLEDVDELVTRIDEAADLLDVDDIAITTNGVFPVDGELTGAQQRAKLQLVEMTARYFWGNEL